MQSLLAAAAAALLLLLLLVNEPACQQAHAVDSCIQHVHKLQHLNISEHPLHHQIPDAQQELYHNKQTFEAYLAQSSNKSWGVAGRFMTSRGCLGSCSGLGSTSLLASVSIATCLAKSESIWEHSC
jgi:hypothetical protein